MKIHEIGPFTTENGIIINTMCSIASSHNKIEHPAILIDDIVTIFNATINCTGHPILHALCHMTNDIAPVKEHIAMLQRIGY